jgi:hypothetical protein
MQVLQETFIFFIYGTFRIGRIPVRFWRESGRMVSALNIIQQALIGFCRYKVGIGTQFRQGRLVFFQSSGAP